MKETLYTIPVNDAFNTECECPVCAMYKKIESDAVDFTIGPSYMEDDVRAVTDKKGFCNKHAAMLYEQQNRLGLALILNTHLQYIINNVEILSSAGFKAPSLFHKNTSENQMIEFLNKINSSCYICERINSTFELYISTIFHLYSTDPEFVSRFENSKGVCSEHFVLLYNSAARYLSGRTYENFISFLTNIYIDNLKRIKDELEWFTDKFDYRNANAPWKNSKDALPRTLEKTNSGFVLTPE